MDDEIVADEEIAVMVHHYLTDEQPWSMYPGAIEQIRASEARRNVWWRRLLRWVGSFGE